MKHCKNQRMFNFDIEQFRTLQAAVIDASSLIYAQKAGFLEVLQASLTLYTLQEIIEETGFEELHIHIIPYHNKELSNDFKLVSCAIEHQLPVISEDKQILMRVKEAHLPYYNSLMMLNCLFFKQKIHQEQYSQYLRSLKDIARYSRKIWEYGERVHGYCHDENRYKL